MAHRTRKKSDAGLCGLALLEAEGTEKWGGRSFCEAKDPQTGVGLRKLFLYRRDMAVVVKARIPWFTCLGDSQVKMRLIR